VVGSVDTETTACKGIPEDALVGTSESVYIGLNPGVTCGQDCIVKCVSIEQPLVENCLQVGLQGWMGSESMKRCMKTTFPSEVVGSVRELADQPWAPTSPA